MGKRKRSETDNRDEDEFYWKELAGEPNPLHADWPQPEVVDKIIRRGKRPGHNVKRTIESAPDQPYSVPTNVVDRHRKSGDRAA